MKPTARRDFFFRANDVRDRDQALFDFGHRGDGLAECQRPLDALRDTEGFLFALNFYTKGVMQF